MNSVGLYISKKGVLSNVYIKKNNRCLMQFFKLRTCDKPHIGFRVLANKLILKNQCSKNC